MDLERRKRELLDYYKRFGYAKTEKIIKAFLKVPREEFIPDELRNRAYVDSPLPIGNGQTISAPHMIFIMCEALEPALDVGAKVLEIGAGSGYHAAVCAEIVAPTELLGKEENLGHVYTVERIPKLAEFARKNLEKTGYANRVTIIVGDGTLGLEDYAPYNAINVTAAGPQIPPPLIDQLSPDGGRLIIPVGELFGFQKLILVIKEGEKVIRKDLGGVSFVPLKGKYGW
ncbi:MAG: protein-L-isoaspartate O-methyltransferase [Candidatus Helarchaeota archaeon]